MLNPSIEVKRNSEIEGAGLVAGRFIQAGDVLFQIDNTIPLAHQHEQVYWPIRTRKLFLKYACQVGNDEFCFMQGDIHYINHSCDPSGWWESYGVLTARRSIKQGEEITYDYSTSDIQLNYQMACMCGSDDCRGTVTSNDYLNSDFQIKYANHLPEHVVEAIELARSGGIDPQRQDGIQVPEEVSGAVRQTITKVHEFQTRFKGEYVFEMIRQTILQVQFAGSDPQKEPELKRQYDDKYIFELVRQLILNSLQQMIIDGRLTR